MHVSNKIIFTKAEIAVTCVHVYSFCADTALSNKSHVTYMYKC